MKLRAAAAVAVLLLAGCASSADRADGVSVVASTDVYGELVEQIAGAALGHGVRVTSIIDNPGQDPHEFEASTQTRLLLARADLIVENGGGYDDFVDQLRRGNHAPVLNAVDISGKPVGDDFNEHVFYDLATMRALVARIAAELRRLDPRDATTFTAGAARLDGGLRALLADAGRIGAAHAGAAVAITEPVPLYLLGACGLANRTPTAFSEAVENGTDASPRVFAQVRQLLTDRQVRLFVYNEQSADGQTDQLLALARRGGVPVVPVTETLPANTGYLDWMRQNLAAIAQGLDRG